MLSSRMCHSSRFCFLLPVLLAPPRSQWKGICVIMEVAVLVTKIVGAPLFQGFLSLRTPPPWLGDVAVGKELAVTSHCAPT